MPWYNDLRPSEGDINKQEFGLIFPDMKVEEKKRCIEKLLILRQGLRDEIPVKKTDQNLILGTWNIKEFGQTTQRKPESYFYIAEIINRYDLIAIQEIKYSLDDINIILRILGTDWAYMMNDITEGNSGNKERSAYIYNKKSVELAGIAGEITLWDELTANSSIKQLNRTPYLTGFNAGWKKFSLINLHLHPGEGDNSDGTNDIAIRKEEVRLFLEAVDSKIKNNRFWNNNLIVVGDFNFYNDTLHTIKDGPAIQLFHSFGFKEINALKGINTNVSNSQVYDHLFFYINKYFKIQTDENGEDKGGVFNPFKYVFTDADVPLYSNDMREFYNGSLSDSSYFQRYWKRNQISDHLPVWAEIIIDSSDDFLSSRLPLF
jgi:exonuclease III